MLDRRVIRVLFQTNWSIEVLDRYGFCGILRTRQIVLSGVPAADQVVPLLCPQDFPWRFGGTSNYVNIVHFPEVLHRAILLLTLRRHFRRESFFRLKVPMQLLIVRVVHHV